MYWYRTCTLYEGESTVQLYLTLSTCTYTTLDLDLSNLLRDAALFGNRCLSLNPRYRPSSEVVLVQEIQSLPLLDHGYH